MEQKKDVGYIVPHTHWDREWRYPIWQNRMLLVQFMEDLLRILDTDPEYKSFVLDGQSVVIEDYLEVRPENKEKVMKYIAAGRISVGPWYTLPDLYPVEGECLIRNLLKGLRLSGSFGGYLKVGYNSFGWGQTAQFPQIYDGFGFDVIIAAKNISKSRAPESEFLWEAPDGTRVLTTRLGHHARANFFMNSYIPIMHGMNYLEKDYKYDWENAGTAYHQADEKNFYQDYFKLENTESIHEDVMKEAIEKAWEGTNETTVKNHRLLMNGSDFSTPQPLLTEVIKRANELFSDREFVNSTLENYMDILKEEVDYEKLTVVKGEMRDGPSSSCSSNALSTRSYIKRLNKKVQNLLLHTAEPLSVMGAMAGIGYQKKFLEIAMTHMLLSHAHDSINGVTQDKTANDVLYRLAQAQELSEVVINSVCSDLVSKIDMSVFEGKDILLVIVNPSTVNRSDVLKICVDTPQEYSIWDFDVVDSQGNLLATQHISREEGIVPVHEMSARPWPFAIDRHFLYLQTKEVPACGYQVYKLVPKKNFVRNAVFWADMRTSSGNEISKSSNTMENEFLKVSVNANGSITIYDKHTKQKYENLNYFEDTGDCGDYWVYYPPYNNKTFTSKSLSAKTWLEDNGPVSATIGVEIMMQLPAYAQRPENGFKGKSKRSEEVKEVKITTYYSLKKGSKKVEVKLKVDNTVEDHRLRVLFDTGITAEYSSAAGHFTVDKRPVSPVREVKGEYYPEMQTMPHQTFVDLSDGKKGLALINNCLSEFEAMDNEERTLALTLFRSVRNIICSEFRSAGVFEHEKGGQSLGVQEYEYAIYPHAGDWSTGKVYVEAEKFNVPLKPIQTSKHKGSLPLEQGFITVKPEELVVTAIKKAEDRESYIVRLFNPTEATLMGSIEVVSAIKEAFMTNLNEKRLEALSVKDAHKIELEVMSNKIVTVEFVL
ncbi:MAG: alpha-mannosidase [Vallitaleaceae bacterium]|nr:alpha-mannosidase [Vallitaleaceae bacterium]